MLGLPEVPHSTGLTPGALTGCFRCWKSPPHRHIEKTQVEADDIINWLKENSPSLEPYLYKKWDEQTQEFVSEVIRNTVPNGALIESTLSGVKTREVVLESSPRSKQSAEKATVSSISIEDDIISSTSIDDDDIKFDDDDDDFYKGLSDD